MGMVDQKRIAKNTVLLYMRMGLIMIISLWASRVVLHALGQTDFGLYNVVSGIVVAFSFLNGVMNSSCNRYYSTELGKQDYARLHEVFKVNVTIFLILAAAIFVLAETVGLWILEHKLVIPIGRMDACRWVFHLSILTFLCSVISVPYKAIITAKEKMKVYAYCSVVEAILKLGIVFMISISPIDKLVFYAALMLLVSFGTNIFYLIYCRHFYSECRYDWHCDRALAREIASFNGWGILGSLASIGRNQGINILLNMFFGPAVNAARGLANQVYFNIYQFVQNYALAFNPQIVKSYAAGEKDDMMKLVFQASRFSYFLLYIIVLPLMLEMPTVLKLWLVSYPAHTVAFASIMLGVALVESMHAPLYYCVQATGKVKWYNILVGGSQLMIVFTAYFLLKFAHVGPESVIWLILIFSVITECIRIAMAVRYAGMNLAAYLKKVILPIIIVSLLALIPPAAIVRMMDPGIGRLALTIAASLVVSTTCIWFAGMLPSEREQLKTFLRRRHADKV